jgi:hypothetical protein
MRFDPARSVYRDCKWCRGNGCLYCAAEADKAYKAAFPNGPQPLATFNLSDPSQLEVARKSIGVEAIQKAFGKDGGGVAEIIQNIADASSTPNREDAGT